MMCWCLSRLINECMNFNRRHLFATFIKLTKVFKLMLTKTERSSCLKVQQMLKCNLFNLFNHLLYDKLAWGVFRSKEAWTACALVYRFMTATTTFLSGDSWGTMNGTARWPGTAFSIIWRPTKCKSTQLWMSCCRPLMQATMTINAFFARTQKLTIWRKRRVSSATPKSSTTNLFTKYADPTLRASPALTVYATT